MKIKLIRSNDNFCLMGAADAKIVVTHTSLFVRSEAVVVGVPLARKQSRNCHRQISHKTRRVQEFSGAGKLSRLQSREAVHRSAAHEHRDRSRRQRAFNGSREHNPFNFRHHNVSEISLYLNGQQQYAVKPLQPNFEEGLYVRTYNTLFAGTNKINRDEGNFITREDYKAYYALYTFDLTADLTERDRFNLVKHGSVRLALRFSKPTPYTVSIIAYAEFDNFLEIDRDRNLLVDFGV